MILVLFEDVGTKGTKEAEGAWHCMPVPVFHLADYLNIKDILPFTKYIYLFTLFIAEEVGISPQSSGHPAITSDTQKDCMHSREPHFLEKCHLPSNFSLQRICSSRLQHSPAAPSETNTTEVKVLNHFFPR